MRDRLNANPLALAAALLALLAMTAIFSTVLWRIASSAHDAPSDFVAFYAAGRVARTGDAASLYDPEVIERAERLAFPGELDETRGYFTPVFVAWLFAPLSLFPYTASYFLYLAANAALLAAALRLLARPLDSVPAGVRALALGAGALSLPAVATLVFGQVDALVLLGLTGGYLLLRSGRFGWAGLALALALVKPHFLLGVGLYLLVRREWPALASLAAAAFALLVAVPLATAPSTLLSSIDLLLSSGSADAGLSIHPEVMSNWRGFVVSVTNSDEPMFWLPGLAVIAVFATGAAMLAWQRSSERGGFDQAYSVAVLLPLVVTPHLYTQSLVLLLLPTALLLRASLALGDDDARRRRAVDLVLAAYAAFFFLPFAAIQGMSLTFFLVAALYLTVALRWPGPVPETKARALREFSPAPR